jgi:hypothetical protein
VNDPTLTDCIPSEFIPGDAPRDLLEPADLPDGKTSKLIALGHRPEIRKAIKQVDAARVRMGIADRELLPSLDLFLETYASGLEGRSDVGSAMGNQFTEGEPSYSIGLEFEVPLPNQTGKSRFRRRQLDLQREMSRLYAITEEVLLDAEDSRHEVENSYSLMVSNYYTMIAAREELDYFERRWKLLPPDNESTSLYIERMLSAQGELVKAEHAFASARAAYNVALLNLRRAEGTLLEFHHFPPAQPVPRVVIPKPTAASPRSGASLVETIPEADSPGAALEQPTPKDAVRLPSVRASTNAPHGGDYWPGAVLRTPPVSCRSPVFALPPVSPFYRQPREAWQHQPYLAR